jgi:hypothetical protein
LECPVQMGPFYTNTSVVWLAPALASMSLPAVMPGLTEKLIVQVDMYPPAIPINVPFTATMNNPIDASMTVTHMTASIYSDGILLATVNADVDIYIPPRSQVVSEEINANGQTSAQALGQFTAMKAAGFGYVDVYSRLEAYVENFPVSIVYNQMDTLTYIH